MVRVLQAKLDEKDLVINQQGLEKEKVKEKCNTKIQQRDKKMRKEMQQKIIQSKEEFEVWTRSCCTLEICDAEGSEAEPHT